MLPHKHFLITGLTVAPVTIVMYPEKSAVDITQWVLFGGVLSAAIDLDVVALIYLKSRTETRLRPFRNVVNIFRDFKGLKDVLAETGVLKVGITSHFIVSAFLVLFFYFYANTYFVPAVLAIISHMISDLPNYRKILK